MIIKDSRFKLIVISLVGFFMFIYMPINLLINYKYDMFVTAIMIISILFFGSCLVIALTRIFRPAYIEIKDDKVIIFTGFTYKIIKYDNIKDIYIYRVKGNKFLSINLYEPLKNPSFMDRVNSSFGYADINLANFYSKKLKEICEILNQKLEIYRSKH